MSRFALATTAAALGLTIACTSSGGTPMSPESVTIPLQVTAGGGASVEAGLPPGVPDHFGTHLAGRNERPTPNSSKAQGQAILQLSPDGSQLHFRLQVANIINVTQAHIHLGPVDGTGGIVAWLYPAAPPLQLIPGRTQGTLGEGTITAASLVGALAGHPLSDLVDAMKSGGAYANVHTLAFPPGEIRGQIEQ